jgi:integrase
MNTDQGNGLVADRAQTYLAKRIAEMASRMPELAELTPNQVDAISRAVLIDELKSEMKRAVLAARTDWNAEAAAFLSDKKSTHTRDAYGSALRRFFAWLGRKNLSPADITPRLADDYIRDLRAEGKDADSSRLYIAAVSSFFTFLERRFDELRNPFRGTKARPAATWKTAVIPSPSEIETIIKTADPFLAAAVSVVAETGLRVGGLASLTIKPDGTFTSTVKGKLFISPAPLTPATRTAIKAAHLDARRPFNPAIWEGRGESNTPVEDRFTIAMKTRLARHVAALVKAGRIKAAYSWHDFRHAFAERNADKGLVWIRDRLGQSSIAVTEKYLRNVLGKDTKGL